MRRNRLGCLSGTGILAALVTTLLIAGYAYARGGLLFNPGPLNSQPGAMLGGITSHAETGAECEACHTAPWDAARMADRCTVCHQEIAEQMRDVATLHGTLLHNNVDLGCRHCHPEHRGPDAALTLMEDLSAFPHEAVGFSLNRHQFTAARESFQCADCHHDDVTTFDLNTCDVCHRQMTPEFMNAHTSSFGRTCLDCHDGVDRFGKNFDHRLFSFQLTGKHAELDCAQCHINARGLADLAAAPQDCYICHHQDDAHGGQFGTDCAACHNPSDWKDADFDHSLSNFPLTGAHVNVACESCHAGGQFRGLDTACIGCHAEPVFHAGLFAADCAGCHSTTSWSPAAFNEQHTFPLNHGDAATCATCHPAGLIDYTCYGCHEHNEAEVRSKHLDEGMSNFQNCMECHPTGQKEEGGDRDSREGEGD